MNEEPEVTTLQLRELGEKALELHRFCSVKLQDVGLRIDAMYEVEKILLKLVYDCVPGTVPTVLVRNSDDTEFIRQEDGLYYMQKTEGVHYPESHKGHPYSYAALMTTGGFRHKGDPKPPVSSNVVRIY